MAEETTVKKQIEMSIADEGRFIRSFSEQFDYRTNKLEDETEATFAVRMIIEWVKSVVKKQEMEAVKKQAAIRIDQLADSLGITITDVEEE